MSVFTIVVAIAMVLVLVVGLPLMLFGWDPEQH